MKSNKVPVKGMVFGGCSFTWGQGLYYYSNLPTLQEPAPDHFDHRLVNNSHLKYMEMVRYPRQVANHFNTWELVAPGNGGSNLSVIAWWKDCFSDFNTEPKPNLKQHSLSEISHFTFQLTQYHRDNFIFEFEGRKYNVPFAEVTNGDMQTIFLKWLSQNNTNLDEWMEQYITGNVQRVADFLQQLEKAGVKTHVIVWPNNYMKYILANDFIKARIVELNYKDRVYDNIETMMKENRELEIKHDVENFIETPQDHHPSLTCHKVMADSLIKNIEKNL